MGEITGIAWTDHTFNPWIGCTKISAGCKNCYAARDNNRYRWVGEWGKDYRLTSDENWKKPIRWAENAVTDGVTRRVFCASLSDVFDNKVCQEWRDRLWILIDATYAIGGLEWLILTKRPENIKDMYPNGLYGEPSIRMGVTAENQEMFDKRLPILMNHWRGKNFVSVEPMLSRINIEQQAFHLDWVIAGCESGSSGRECRPEWARDLRDQCGWYSIPFFLKQLMDNDKLVVKPVLDGMQWLQFPEDK
jgi:protein gp37